MKGCLFFDGNHLSSPLVIVINFIHQEHGVCCRGDALLVGVCEVKEGIRMRFCISSFMLVVRSVAIVAESIIAEYSIFVMTID